MSLQKASNFGNPHIGLFARASDKFLALDASCSPKFLLAFEKLGLPSKQVTIGGSGLVGVFLAMNSNGALLPHFATKDEAEVFRQHVLNVMRMPSRFGAAGNNVSANDFGAVVNPEMKPSEIKSVSDCLGVEAVAARVAGYLTVGSCLLATNKGFACHNRADEEELKELKSILKVDGLPCTANTGVPFVSLGAVANSSFALFGEECTGFEAGRLLQALSLV